MQIETLSGFFSDTVSDTSTNIDPEQALITDAQTLSFVDALGITQITSDDEQEKYWQDNIPEAAEESDEIPARCDPIAYLQQFLPLENQSMPVLEKGDSVLENQSMYTANNTNPLTQPVSSHTEEMPMIPIEEVPPYSDRSGDILRADAPITTLPTQEVLGDAFVIEPTAAFSAFSQDISGASIEPPELENRMQAAEMTVVSSPIEHEDAPDLSGLLEQPENIDDMSKEQAIPSTDKPFGIESQASTTVTETRVDTSRSVSGEYTLQAPVQSDEWGDEFNQRILWLGQQKIDKALLQLHPIDLGPIQIQIHMQDNQAHMQIQVNDAQVQQRIQDSLPELKALLEMQGLGLGQTSIDRQGQGRQGQEQAYFSPSALDDVEETRPKASSVKVFGETRRGGVDTYA